MDWTHLKPTDGRLMPWKNGGGTTLELAVEPPGATLETGFHWRLSSAEVAVSGAFSCFPGLERWLVLLEGSGFDIDFGAQGLVELREPFAPVLFSGEWAATATLVAGRSEDLNLMVDPRRCRARMDVLQLASPQALPLFAATTLLFMGRGTVSVPNWKLHLGPRHLLRIDAGHGEVFLAPGVGGATCVRVDLEPIC
jgi:environmental stress-induced protein Ves